MGPWMLLPAALLLGPQSISNDHKSKETIGRCLLVAEGHSYILNPCVYYFHESLVAGIDYSLEFRQKRPRNHFFRFGRITFGSAMRTVGEGSWNGPDIRNLHGDHFVGTMRRKGNCWVNAQARFCFWPARAAR